MFIHKQIHNMLKNLFYLIFNILILIDIGSTVIEMMKTPALIPNAEVKHCFDRVSTAP